MEAEASGEPVAPPPTEMRRSSRDAAALAGRLERWLAGRLPSGADPSVPEVESTSANGMSSDTVLFRAAWTEGGGRRQADLVARLAPDPGDVPVFPSYDMGRQFDTIRLVSELTSVPVPTPRWCEADPSYLGAAFFVMDRVEGDVPPDVMPYNFGDSWLYHASPDEQRRLQDSTVGVLAQLHSIDGAERRFPFLDFGGNGSYLRRHVDHTHAWYRFAADDGVRSPLVERGFAWLEEHWPSDEGAPVLSWGDARIGNVMYRDFEPAAVLDWEMAGLGPRELDLAWMVYAHHVFEDMAQRFGLGGMPDFLRLEDAAGTYESLTGSTPRHLDFYQAYASVQWGIVFLRTGCRQVRFGEREMPDDVDDLLHHRPALERILS
ncbi:MAG TPA: phosphotransferase family protein [Acidimicrobiales bacterium]|nr:phosphotransferase family protein [Acidimicrobiales bacterium]